MPTPKRNSHGRFELKGASPRRVRSIRMTDETLDKLYTLASKKGMGIANYLEDLVQDSQQMAIQEYLQARKNIIYDVRGMLLELLEPSQINGHGKQSGIVRRVHQRIIDLLG